VDADRLALATLAFAMFPLSAFAQQDWPPDRPPDDCYTTLKTGSGAAYTKVCISSAANISSFESPAGAEHISFGEVIEGCRVCRSDTGSSPSYDSGVIDYHLDGPSIYQPNGRNTLPLRITRAIPRSLDFQDIERGPLRLVQEFFWRTWNYGPAELYISMKVYNDGSVTVPGVKIQRFFDEPSCLDSAGRRASDRLNKGPPRRSSGAPMECVKGFSVNYRP
jgi:hypothetical protein